MNEWIPIEHRLPSFGENVIITSVDRCMKDGVRVELASCEFDRCRHIVYWETEKDIIGNNLVKAWMPFPKPYGTEWSENNERGVQAFDGTSSTQRCGE